MWHLLLSRSLRSGSHHTFQLWASHDFCIKSNEQSTKEGQTQIDMIPIITPKTVWHNSLWRCSWITWTCSHSQILSRMTLYEICISLDGVPQAAFVVMHIECTLNIIISPSCWLWTRNEECISNAYPAAWQLNNISKNFKPIDFYHFNPIIHKGHPLALD